MSLSEGRMMARDAEVQASHLASDHRRLDSSPLIVFAGGGTGGHLYPALAIMQALRGLLPDVRFLFFSSQREIDDRILTRANVEPVRQPLAPLSRLPWRWPGVIRRFRESSRLCRARFDRDRPAVVVGTGGLASVPAVQEAVRAGVPTALLNPDLLPGRANRLLSRRVHVIFAQWSDTIGHLRSRTHVIVSGCPVRPEFTRPDRSAGLQRFGFQATRKTLLITGASQGARSINQAVVANLDFLESRPDWQVLHLTGHADYEAVERAYRNRAIPAAVMPFTEHMADALAAADLVVARAGASTLAEITAVGRASVLMPYPYHRDRHQWANAGYLAKAGAARFLRDAVAPAVNGPALRQTLEPLMADEKDRASIASAARRIGRPDAASQIARSLVSLMLPSSPAANLDPVQAFC